MNEILFNGYYYEIVICGGSGIAWLDVCIESTIVEGIDILFAKCLAVVLVIWCLRKASMAG